MAKKSSAKKIDATPYGSVTGLATPTRSNNEFTASWKLPSNATSTKRKDRWKYVEAVWTFDQSYSKSGTSSKNQKTAATKMKKKLLVTSGGTKRTKKKKVKDKKTKKVSVKNVTIASGAKTLGDGHQEKIVNYPIPLKTTTIKQKVDFAQFFPSTNYYLHSVKVAVRGWNGYKPAKGKKGSAYGKTKTSHVYKFEAPAKPNFSALSLSETGVASFTLTSKSSKAAQHLYNTEYWVTRQDNFTSAYKNDAVYIAKTTLSASTESKAVTKDIDDVRGIGYNDYIKLTAHATARGCKGSTKADDKPGYISYPNQPGIKSIEVKYDSRLVWNSKTKKWVANAATGRSGIVKVNVDARKSTEHPTDTMELQRIKTTVGVAANLPTDDGSWTTVVSDNGTCTALQDTVEDAYPDRGVHVWYRIKAKHFIFTRYSEPLECAALYHGPTKPVIVDASVRDDGTKPTYIRLYYGWKSGDDGDGTEISWSPYVAAISGYSNITPDTATSEYCFGQTQAKKIKSQFPSRSKGLAKVSEFQIANLTEGEKYYVAMRRYADSGSGTVYSDRTFWSADGVNTTPITFGIKPRNVKLILPESFRDGEECQASWTYDSNLAQTHYTLYYIKSGDSKATVLRAKTKSTSNSTMITTDEIKRALDKDGKTMTLRVEVDTDGLSATSSNAKTVKTLAPDLKLTLPSGVLTEKPFKFGYQSNQANCRLLLRLESEGITGEIVPGVDYDQPIGDVVWTGALKVSDGTGSFSVPTGVQLWDGGRYTLVGKLVNQSTGQESPERRCTFRVGWEHQAMPPNDELSIVKVDDEAKIAYITAYKPENFDEERPDHWDLYRVTPDGADRVAENIPFGTTVTDRYAPYSKTAILRYALVTVTPDGDTSYCEVGYNLNGYAIRFDWGNQDDEGNGGRHLEVPYNLRIGDSYEKDFERRRHMDGSISGYWNPGTFHNGNLQTDLVKLSDPEQKELVKELARYTGPIFVRTPDGSAYQGDVQVTQFQTDYDSLVVPVTFDVKGIDLSDRFMAEFD